MNIERVDIKKLVMNPNNPRTIKDAKFKKLVKSIKEFPEMLEVRPIVVDDDMIVLGGNMRTKACIEAGLTEVPIIKFSNLSDEKKKEFIVKDNVGYGEWDFELLLEDWDKDTLLDWGMDIPNDKNYNEYTKKIEIPIYEPNYRKPLISELFNLEKYNNLINEIDNSDLEDIEKDFLRFAASRHIVFNYDMIADYYCNSDINTQELMEKSALVIIDFNKAIENGFISLTENIRKQYSDEYGE
jgi:hypothetical protein